PVANPEQLADPLHGRVAIALGVLRQQLQRDERAIRLAADDIGERAAAIDPELPASIHCESRRETASACSMARSRFSPARSFGSWPLQPRRITPANRFGYIETSDRPSGHCELPSKSPPRPMCSTPATSRMCSM